MQATTFTSVLRVSETFSDLFPSVIKIYPIPSGSSGFRTFSHSSCLLFRRSSSSASDTNLLLITRSAVPSPPSIVEQPVLKTQHDIRTPPEKRPATLRRIFARENRWRLETKHGEHLILIGNEHSSVAHLLQGLFGSRDMNSIPQCKADIPITFLHHSPKSQRHTL